MQQIRISAKNLGYVALDEFCPRCFWVKLKTNHRLPFQIFPGIFSSLDSYSKRLVHDWFDRNDKSPDWLSELGKFNGYRNPPHYSKFNCVVEDYNILLTGSPDGILIREDDSFCIIDYKTAKYTNTQDKLFSMYETQLNVYALIAEEVEINPVSGLALIYTEPVTTEPEVIFQKQHSERGFQMNFSAYIKEVQINNKILIPLLEKTREIFDCSNPPESRDKCKNCKDLNIILKLLA